MTIVLKILLVLAFLGAWAYGLMYVLLPESPVHERHRDPSLDAPAATPGSGWGGHFGRPDASVR